MPKQQKKQTFLHGAAILVAGMMVVKVIGALFKIPLNNLLDGVGMAYFSSAYTIFNTLYSLAVAGMPIAVSKMVSECVVLGRFRDAKKIMRLSLYLFVLSGTVGCLLMLAGAKPLSVLVNNPGAFLSIAVMSPAVIFCCLMAAYRGYYQGLSNMYPTAISEIVEALAKLLFGTSLAYFSIQLLEKEYAEKGSILGKAITDTAEAQVVISQYSAAAAILGIAISTAVGFVYLFFRHALKGDGISREQLTASPSPKSSKKILKRMIGIAIPVCLGAVAMNLTSLIDMASVMNRLGKAIETDSAAVLASYAGMLPPDLHISYLPEYLYGSYTGIAVTLFNLVPALTTTFGVSALPAISAAWVSKNKKNIKATIESVLRVTALLAIPAGIGISVLAEPIAALIFYKVPLEAAIGGQLLRTLGLSAALVALSTPINSILQGIGRVMVPVRMMVIGGVIKLVTNFIFVAVPSINIHAAPFGTLLCYTVIVSLSLYVLAQTTHISINYISVFGKPLLAGILCGLCAWASYGLIHRFWDSSIVTIIAIGLAGIVYVVSILLLRGICKQDVLMLPGGEKVAKLLEKHSLLG